MTYALVSLISSVIGGVILAGYQRWRDVPTEIERHDRGAYELNEDLRRFVRDRDVQVRDVTKPREFADQLARIIRQHGLSSGVQSAEARREAIAEADQIVEAKRAALHEYRDAASRAIRALRALGGREGRLHRLVRRRTGKSAPRLAIPDDCVERLRIWRAPVSVQQDLPVKKVPDPTRPELEPDLAVLETKGITWATPAAGVMPPS